MVSIPTDAKYGWVVVFAAFLSNMLVDGFVFNFGQFTDDIQRLFGVKNPETILSVMTCVYFGIGPITSALLNHFGYQVTGAIGATFTLIGVFVTAYADTYPLLMLSFGALCGAGSGITTCTCILVVGHYFDRYRALANAVAVCGTGAGTVFMGQVIPLFKEYGWADRQMIFSSFFLALYPLIATFKSLEPHVVRVTPKDVNLLTSLPFSSSLFSLLLSLPPSSLSNMLR